MQKEDRQKVALGEPPAEEDGMAAKSNGDGEIGERLENAENPQEEAQSSRGVAFTRDGEKAGHRPSGSCPLFEDHVG